ncbi:1-acyl-sn-glycerol-3-phosphate acyltransferase [Parasphingopyxis algicola]|uniref:lysophospholipid acyltransferase family protein n=1 Tax=Parasphingopyxis algicola TaxID=2026624 RepID=UPI0015A3EF26|nr:lysophospholipid acyltransferase family protein [Parasphingopyxis algicola]QLC25615.1 1-acyl-sn-glycerol-3-phosphate acyltransferase [Parasphingopyxis algicola]
MAAIRSLLFMLVFYGLTVPWVIAALVGAARGDKAMHSVIYAWVRFHRWCARAILGIRVEIEGTIPDGQYLFAAKHQAMFETLDFLNLLDTPAPVLKKELTGIPGWGWLAKRYGGIAVDRSGGAGAMRIMLKRTREVLADGRSVVIFPEGTRVLPGETPPLQAGFAGLYKMVGLPVVPIAIRSGHVWPRNKWVKYPGVVTFRFFEPIPTGLPRAEIEARVHRLINDFELE